MDIYTIDFETYYSRDYSLSKITTEMYVRDDRFEAILVGIKKNNGPVKWVPAPMIAAFLKAIDFSNAAILCHNTAFDGAILSWHYGVKPKLWLDTLSMARPLHNVSVGGSLKALAQYYKLGAKGDEVVNALGKRYADFSREELTRYAAYCVNDVELTYQLWLRLRKELPASELLVIDQTLRMYTEPKIELDKQLLLQHLGEVRSSKEKLLELVAEAMADGDHTIHRDALKPMLMSNPQMALLLERLGVEPPTKVSVKTGKTAFAFSKTDKDFTDLLEHQDERVRAAVEARLGVKSTLEETRTLAFIGISDRGPLPIMLNYYGAHTGRFSGGDKVNLQNLPSRGNTTIRRALKAPEGYEIIACDSSQIEARTVAWLAGQDDLVQAFREGRDVYSEFASDVYGRKITKADYTERFVGKTCILGLGYGMGAEKFRRTLALAKIEIDEHEALRIVKLYRQKYFKIVQLWQTCGHVLTNMVSGVSGMINDKLEYDNTGITLPNGLKITYPALRQNGSGFEYINDARTYRKFLKDRVLGLPCDDLPWVRIYGGKVTENLVQALAGIIVRDQMVKIGLAGHFVAFQVHDENVCVVRTDEADAAEAEIIRIMSTPPKWAPDLPIACEAGRADNYGDC